MAWPSLPPPPIPSISSRRLMPSGTSTRPVLATWPTSEKTTVPLLPGAPSAAYHAAPRAMIAGIMAHDLTLLMTVGIRHSPATAG